MIPSSSRPGFTFLLIVLAIGIMSLTIAIALIQNSVSIQDASLYQKNWLQAFENAQSCSDLALDALQSNPFYVAGETRTLAFGTCRIAGIGGFDYEHRTVCVEGTSGEVTRYVELEADSLFPSITISKWRELYTLPYTLCAP